MNLQSVEKTGIDKTRRGRRLWIAMVVLCAIGAAAALRRIAVLVTAPAAGSTAFTGLDASFAAKADLTLLHIVPSLLFVVLVPLQFVSSLRRRHPGLHRWTGRVLMVLDLVLGITALRLSAHPVGGIVEGTATTFFGCFFLLSLFRAWWHIRSRRIELHREWVTRMVAIALGVATTRPIMGICFATSRFTGLTPEQFFGPAMWMGLLSTYLVGEAWIQYSRSSPAAKSPSFLRSV